jgi:hypothetical protein
MAKSRKRKGHNEKLEKRNMMAARSMAHSAKRKQNLEDNVEKFKQAMKELIEEQQSGVDIFEKYGKKGEDN